jgi:hypothetical protein
MTTGGRGAGQPGGHSSTGGPDAGSLLECEALLSRFEMRLAVSPGDDRLTSLVEEEMRSRKVPFPNNHKFLITNRGGRAWSVTVVDFAAICRGERPRGTTYRVGEDSGHLRILYEEAGI